MTGFLFAWVRIKGARLTGNVQTMTTSYFQNYFHTVEYFTSDYISLCFWTRGHSGLKLLSCAASVQGTLELVFQFCVLMLERLINLFKLVVVFLVRRNAFAHKGL